MLNENRILKIDPEFKNFLPELSEEEYRQLEENIEKIGCLIDPIVIWKGHDIIVDGHNRHQICTKLDIPLKIEEIEFEDREAVKEYMIAHHIGRRTFSPFQRIELTLKVEKIIEEKAKAHQSAGGGVVKQKSAHSIKTREELARVAGVSHDTLSKAKKILAEASETDIQRLREGKTKINAVFKKLESQVAEVDKPVDSQEKKVASWIDDIVNKISKFAKMKDKIPERLREQAKDQIVPLINQIFGS